MSVSDLREQFGTPSFVTAAGTVASYLLVLGLMFVVLFVIPFLAFLALG